MLLRLPRNRRLRRGGGERALRLGEVRRLRLQRLRRRAERAFLLLEFRGQRGRLARARRSPSLGVSKRRRRLGELGGFRLQDDVYRIEARGERRRRRVAGVRGDASLRRRRPRLGVAEGARHLEASRLRRRGSTRGFLRALLLRQRRLASVFRGLKRHSRVRLGGGARARRRATLLRLRLRARARLRRRLAERLERRARLRVAPRMYLELRAQTRRLRRLSLRRLLEPGARGVRVGERRRLRSELRPRAFERFAQRRRFFIQGRNPRGRLARLFANGVQHVTRLLRFPLPRLEPRGGGDALGARRVERQTQSVWTLRRRLRRPFRGMGHERVTLFSFTFTRLGSDRGRLRFVFFRGDTRDVLGERALGARRATLRLRQSAHQPRRAAFRVVVCVFLFFIRRDDVGCAFPVFKD